MNNSSKIKRDNMNMVTTNNTKNKPTGSKSRIKFLLLTMLLTLFMSGCTGETSTTDTTMADVSTEATDTASESQKTDATDQTGLSEQTDQTNQSNSETQYAENKVTEAPPFDASDIPAYTGDNYIVIHDNVPYFDASELATASYEYYSDLDDLGRCGFCVADIGTDLMPTEERGEIGSIKPTGWQQNKYMGVVDGNYLYNRCHLISYQLTGENANEKNLITGTRNFNEKGMLPFENMVADYIKETGNHVLYRVTPVFDGNNLLADGVLMEAESVEDEGAGILFCVFCFNVQPGIVIDYTDGSNHLENDSAAGGNNEAKASGNTSADKNTASSASAGTTAVVDNSDASTSQTTTAQNDQQQHNAASTIDSSSQQTALSQPAGGGMCWKSATGSKYHSRNNCGNMNPDKAVQITIEQAEAQGLGRCKNCW